MKPIIQLYDNETIEFELQPQSRYATYNFLTSVMSALSIITIIVIQFFNFHGMKQYYNILLVPEEIIVILLCIVILSSFIIEKITIKKQWYFLTSRRCIISGGIWTINKNFLPYTKIVDINLLQTGLRKIFSLYTIVIVCNGTKVVIDGLSSEEAEKVSKFLSEKCKIKINN